MSPLLCSPHFHGTFLFCKACAHCLPRIHVCCLQVKQPRLEIKRDIKGMVIVPGATVVEVTSAKELMATFEKVGGFPLDNPATCSTPCSQTRRQHVRS